MCKVLPALRRRGAQVRQLAAGQTAPPARGERERGTGRNGPGWGCSEENSMTTKEASAKTIDEHIANSPKEVQAILKKIRATIKKAAPDAEETINYGIPRSRLKGIWSICRIKSHIGFYPTPSGIEKFKKELSDYEGAKGSVKFPLDQPIPYDLIEKIVKFRVKENLERAEAKGKKKK